MVNSFYHLNEFNVNSRFGGHKNIITAMDKTITLRRKVFLSVPFSVGKLPIGAENFP